MSFGLSSGSCSEPRGEDAGKEANVGTGQVLGHRAGVGEVGLLSILQLPLLGLVALRSVMTTPQASSIGINTADVCTLSIRARGCWF